MIIAPPYLGVHYLYNLGSLHCITEPLARALSKILRLKYIDFAIARQAPRHSRCAGRVSDAFARKFHFVQFAQFSIRYISSTFAHSFLRARRGAAAGSCMTCHLKKTFVACLHSFFSPKGPHSSFPPFDSFGVR